MNTPILAEMLPSLSPVTFDDVFEQEIFKTLALDSPVWHNDCLSVAYLTSKTETTPALLAEYRIETRAHSILTPVETLQIGVNEDGTPDTLAISGFQFSPDGKTVLIARTPQRRNFGEGDPALYLYHLEEKRLERLTQEEAPYLNAKFSPEENVIGYVKKNDLYLMNLETKREIRLTDTGCTTRYNGRFGWVYEEEIEVSDGWSWSPDGTKIAYLSTDESKVSLVFLPQFDDLHQTPLPQRYPKAGDPNPILKLGVINVAEAVEIMETESVAIPVTRWLLDSETNENELESENSLPEMTSSSSYLARMQWTPDNHLLVQRIPRLQNRLQFVHINSETGDTQILHKELSETWVDLPSEVTFTESTGAFLFLSDKDGYRQIYHFQNGEVMKVTSGDYDVVQIVGTDFREGQVYFTAYPQDSRDLQVCMASLVPGEARTLTPSRGLYTPLFNNNASHFLLTKATRNSPPFTALHRGNGDYFALVHGNEMAGLKGKQIAEWERFEFRTGDGRTLYGQMLKPADFNPEKRYPVLLSVYGGPNSQVTQERYTSGYEQWLASGGYLVVQVDGRGSGGRGRDFRKGVYLKLGEQEAIDQIEAATWLSTLPYIDEMRIGIWGWSYGGYLTLLCLLRGGDLFRAGIAVAPVTDWTFYDSIYTERFMRTPDENPEGYKNSSPLNEAENLSSALLMMHGTGDDNVHYQNLSEFALRLQKANLPFEMMTYSGEKHGLSGVQKHVYRTMHDFLLSNL